MTKRFAEANASPDELWEYCRVEYQSRNPISKYLLSRFYASLGDILKSLNPQSKVLEVGCGAGESSTRIRQMLKDQSFEASDYDDRYVQKLLELSLPYKITRESVYSLQRRDNEFDCLIMLEVLEHLKDVDRALSELFRVSSKYVIISVPFEPVWRMLNLARLKYLKDLGNTPGHINYWNPSSIKELISKYGAVTKIKITVPWIICLAEKLRVRTAPRTPVP